MKPVHLLPAMLVWLSVAAGSHGATRDWTDDYGRLLRRYSTPAGVKYPAWKKNAADMAALERVVQAIAQERRSDLAFYLDAYNAWMLHEALEKYPTKSVKDPAFIFFVSKRIVVGGKKTSFHALETNVIRRKFNDPRIHFALNCASRSCPPLAAAPYSTGDVKRKLEEQAVAFCNSDRGVLVSAQRVELSKIFDWYKEDFGGSDATLQFINKRRTKVIPARAKIAYQNYDWGLNEAR